MADGPSNFVSWQDQLGLTGEQEQRLLDQAMADANATQDQARRSLERSADEARNAQLAEARGGGVATTTLSSTGSYRDYLALKTKANEQYLAAQRSGNAVGSMVRRARAQAAGVNEAWTAQGDALEARQEQLGAASTAGAAGATRLAGEERARAEAKAQEEKDRQAAGERAQATAAGLAYRKWIEGHQNGGAPSDTSRYAQILSTSIDNGWKLPERTTEQRANTPYDVRGWGIENDAWGTPRKPSGRPTTKKGTAY